MSLTSECIITQNIKKGTYGYIFKKSYKKRKGMDTREEIIRIFEENGIDVEDAQNLIDIDSVQYVSIVVDIEEMFDIVLPDYVLEENKFVDFEAFIEIVRAICAR